MLHVAAYEYHRTGQQRDVHAVMHMVNAFSPPDEQDMKVLIVLQVGLPTGIDREADHIVPSEFIRPGYQLKNSVKLPGRVFA